MVCNICGKEMHGAFTDKAFGNGRQGVFLRNVPVYRCECGNLVYDSKITKRVEELYRQGKRS